MITVFTPTYNRAYIIDNLYRSLLSQTDKDFESKIEAEKLRQTYLKG